LPETPLSTEPRDHARVKFPPPFIFAAAAAIGAGVHALWPASVRPDSWGPLGGIVALFALALFLWAGITMHRHETAIEPWRPTKTVVTTGPFELTRNPICLSFALFQVGMGLWADRLAIVLMVIPAVAATNTWVIAREEAYLERKFGDVYRAYLGSVRRWL
jgi:protein-S-isoprenylcysteine O-methyltransferase Ste14